LADLLLLVHYSLLRIGFTSRRGMHLHLEFRRRVSSSMVMRA